MKELGALVKCKNEKKFRGPEHVKTKTSKSDHHNEDPWIKRFYPGSADKCFESYTKIAFHL